MRSKVDTDIRRSYKAIRRMFNIMNEEFAPFTIAEAEKLATECRRFLSWWEHINSIQDRILEYTK